LFMHDSLVGFNTLKTLPLSREREKRGKCISRYNLCAAAPCTDRSLLRMHPNLFVGFDPQSLRERDYAIRGCIAPSIWQHSDNVGQTICYCCSAMGVSTFMTLFLFQAH